MKSKCPGQDNSRDPLGSVSVTCPSCGRAVELFSDEGHRRCVCGAEVRQKVLPKCAEWCPAAAECFGEATDIRVLKARAAEVKNDPRAKQCLQTIQALIKRRNSRERDE
jgi:Fe-S-cluster-containing dehydrogenase component